MKNTPQLKNGAAGAKLLVAIALCFMPLLEGGTCRAAIAQRGSATTATTTGTSLTINKPANVAQGDVMIVGIAQYASLNAPSLAGWTVVDARSIQGSGSTARYAAMLYRVAGPSEGGTYTFTLGSGTTSGAGGIVAFSGVDTTGGFQVGGGTGGPFDVAPGVIYQATGANSTAVAANSITSATANAAVIMFGMAAGGNPSWSGWTTTSPGSLSELYDVASSMASAGAAWGTNVTPGATGAGAATLSIAHRNGGILVALRPASAGNPGNATNSMVAASPTSLPADGVSTSSVTVTLEDLSGLPVSGKTVTLASSRGATDTISAASGPSDASGIVKFSTRSTTPGTSVYTATDVTDGIVVTLTATVVYYGSPLKEFLTFGENYIGSTDVIDTNAATVAWTVPFGTAITNLAPAYTVSPLSTGAPLSGTTRDFTSPQTYTITAQDGSTKIYTVSVAVAAPSPLKEVLTFGTNYAGSAAVIDTNAATIAWSLPFGYSSNSLAPAYTVSPLATGAPASGTTRDFTSPKTYTITAQDGSTKTYTATVTIAPGSPLKEILTFGANYAGSTAIINTNAATVAWTLPVGTSLASLSPSYTVSPNAAGSPASGTARNFTTQQVYTITAQDTSTKGYTVTAAVLVGPQSYGIALATDVAQEFSPMNRSGHPIVTGLDNYSNSVAVGTPSKRGLQVAALKAPWNVNIGQQTMMCSDCHNTDSATTAAQGPHGSAVQYMLRGANATNWPDVTLPNFNVSWCANCHNDAAGLGHTRSDHRGSSVKCYTCHIIVPHGGRMSRLLNSNTGGMPLRYAFSNNIANVGFVTFTKAATNNYSESGNCRVSCGHHTSGTFTESW